MKASETNFLKFLQGPKQFIIPIYQRKYSWTLEQCKQLWNDIVRASNDDEIMGHFVGSVVYIEKGLYQISAVPQLLVIDGQQRMTTLTLLLLALGKAIKQSEETHEVTSKKIKNRYLVNNDEEDDLYHKLLLTKSDKETLLSLIEERDLPENYSIRVYENFQFFIDQIYKSDINLNALYHGINKLIVVDISLDRDHDNPQLIFESLNSTGLELSQADLIRNYVLMKLEPKEQEVLYKSYWYPMEKGFGNHNESSIFDRFMRDYLTLKTGRIPNIKKVYSAFKEYAAKQQESDIEAILKDIYEYSKYFVRLAFQTEKEKEINDILKDINSLKVDVSYPFLLEVYDDYHKQILSKADFIAILKLVESYVFRRAICGIPTNSLNKTFSTLSKEVNKNKYVESVQAVFTLKDSYKRFPDNEEFARELKVKDIYNFRNRNYILRKLENENRKEIVDIESYTIEHIMPQNKNLSYEWRDQLGENWEDIQKTYLHTLGNLTLTRYNSELSDRPFKLKRDIEGGFADSPLRLNTGLGRLEEWNEQEIISRGKRLAEKAVSVWNYPVLSNEVLAEYKKKPNEKDNIAYTINDYPELTGEILELFEQLRKRICNLDTSVREEYKKLYIAYKTTTNFVDIVPQKSRLRLSINMAFDEIFDPKGLCRDVTNIGRWGNGDIEVGVSNFNDIDDAMALIKQSFEKHREERG
ncbi:DUF262 and DUF1524 domain-containing protein [Rossellomorea sp. DA94]|uniref:DUF262 and DUF1524 domain-containing protein n=1 Tax=Rossellomorea sp. DA94 TaxID=3038653 RepID=UPI002447F9B1|nr:DUF262 and DUF1524 domain-containing protein [Rossellomorea sp. DA94]WGG46483.1 DUF262 and DUF1524 domain-containing protein [Rossellomorea sp. DA94]